MSVVGHPQTTDVLTMEKETTMESAQEILQRLLDQRYEEGCGDGYALASRDAVNTYEVGKRDGFDEGLKTGYEKAMFEVQDFVEAQLAPPTKIALADHPGDENDADPAPTENGVGEKPHVLPYQMRAYERLREHPGITSREARKQWGGSNSVLYQLKELGLAEQRGSQFYAKDEARA